MVELEVALPSPPFRARQSRRRCRRRRRSETRERRQTASVVPAVPAPLRQMVPQVMRLKLRAPLLKVKPAMPEDIYSIYTTFIYLPAVIRIPNLGSVVPCGTHGGTEV